MRIGVMTTAAPQDLERAARLGLGGFQWVRFAESPAGPHNPDWKPVADQVASAAKSRELRISAIGAFYQNPLDPRQTEQARAILKRAIEVAAYLGIKTVAAFAGAVIKTRFNERGGNPVYEPFENHLPQVLAFWEPLAQVAADVGVRIAFEHCPQAPFHLPVMGYNTLDRPAVWERFFNTTKHTNLGLEWDPSHLICQFIDPVANLKQFAARVFHVHGKDAYVDHALLARYGPCHPGVAEHRFPGLGQADWGQIIHTLLRSGYDSDISIEGWHDAVYRDHPEGTQEPLAGQKLENTGLLIAKRTLEAYVPRREEFVWTETPVGSATRAAETPLRRARRVELG